MASINCHHRLKTWPQQFQAIKDGRKTFEYRKDDRSPPFEIGDTLGLLEWDPVTKDYTGQHIEVDVTYVARAREDFGIPEGYCVMSIKR